MQPLSVDSRPDRAEFTFTNSKFPGMDRLRRLTGVSTGRGQWGSPDCRGTNSALPESLITRGDGHC